MSRAILHACPPFGGFFIEPTPIIAYFLADRTEIVAGDAVTLGWRVTNATAAQLQAAGRALDVSVEGSIRLAPAQTVTYLLMASNGSADCCGWPHDHRAPGATAACGRTTGRANTDAHLACACPAGHRGRVADADQPAGCDAYATGHINSYSRRHGDRNGNGDSNTDAEHRTNNGADADAATGCCGAGSTGRREHTDGGHRWAAGIGGPVAGGHRCSTELLVVEPAVDAASL